MQVPDPPPVAPPHHVKRLAGLVACVLAGLLVGVIGSAVTGSSVWYLAIPALVAAAWLLIADPTQCRPALDQRDRRHHGNDPAP